MCFFCYFPVRLWARFRTCNSASLVGVEPGSQKIFPQWNRVHIERVNNKIYSRNKRLYILLRCVISRLPTWYCLPIFLLMCPYNIWDQLPVSVRHTIRSNRSPSFSWHISFRDYFPYKTIAASRSTVKIKFYLSRPQII